MSDTESFEYAMKVMRDNLAGMYANGHMTKWGYIDTSVDLDQIKAAHDREIRDTAQQEYHRGYGDGAHSMDAEHRAIAMRLRALRFDGGSHENLARIAYAIYPCATGWTCESADGLRDKLVDLMGGVSDENVHVVGLRCDDGCMDDVSNGEDTGRTHDSPSNRDRNHMADMAVRESVDTMIGDGDDTSIGAGGGACDAADCDCAGEPKEVGDGRTGDSRTRSHPHRGAGRNDMCVGRDSGEHSRWQEVEHGGTTHDCADDSRGRSCGELVHLDGLVTYDVLDNERRKAVCELRKMPDAYNDKKPTRRWYIELCDAIGVGYATTFANVRDRLIHLLGGDQPSGIDVLRAMDAESDTDATSPNDDPSVSITDELRKWASDRHCKGISHTDMLNIGLIADRIDEQFDRICQQQEAVLQETIAEVVKEYEHDRLPDQLRIEKLEKQRDHWHQQATDMMNHADAMEHERDELQAKLDAIRDALDG